MCSLCYILDLVRGRVNGLDEFHASGGIATRAATFVKFVGPGGASSDGGFTASADTREICRKAKANKSILP